MRKKPLLSVLLLVKQIEVYKIGRGDMGLN